MGGVLECPSYPSHKMKDMKIIDVICIMQIICEDYKFNLHYAYKNFILNT